MNDTVAADRTAPATRELSGRWVVLAMLASGVLATAVIFVYWDLHTRPFRPLTDALGREFRHSLPKVEGGRHKGSANTLRIAMRVPFVPMDSTIETQQHVNRVVELARQHANLADFEVLEIHLIQLAPEQAAVQKSFTFPTENVLTSLPFSVEENAAAESSRGR